MNSDSKMGGLISLPGNLSNPRDAKASDWPDVGATGPAGQESGANQLVKQTLTQEGPQHTQDDGPGTPSVWGKDSGFVVGKAKSRSTSLTYERGGVDLVSGQMDKNAAEPEY